jgi:1,4-dihydroxy-2-naphthoate octaprenyltransferase
MCQGHDKNTETQDTRSVAADPNCDAQKPGCVRLWWIASRPYSLTASTMPVIFGTAMAVIIGGAEMHWFRFAAAFAGMVALHVGANLLNDGIDFKRGFDRRVNPVSGAVVRGWITPRRAFAVAGALFAVGSALGAVLVAVAGLPVLWIGLVGVVIGFLYSAGPFALKYHAVGDLAVFLDFGILGAMGAWAVQTGQLSWIPALWAIPMSLLVIGILHANNWRDIDFDTAGGAKTMASLLGDRLSVAYYGLLVYSPYVVVLAIIVLSRLGVGPKMPLTFFITFLTLPLAVRLMRCALGRNTNADPAPFRSLDGATGQLNLAFGLLSTAALVLAAVLR